MWGACIEAGAAAIVSKTLPFDQLVDRITDALGGDAAVSATERGGAAVRGRQHRTEERVRLEPFQRLTVRECEVLHELMEGLPAETIAERGLRVAHDRALAHPRDPAKARRQLAARSGDNGGARQLSSPHRRPN